MSFWIKKIILTEIENNESAYSYTGTLTESEKTDFNTDDSSFMDDLFKFCSDRFDFKTDHWNEKDFLFEVVGSELRPCDTSEAQDYVEENYDSMWEVTDNTLDRYFKIYRKEGKL